MKYWILFFGIFFSTVVIADDHSRGIEHFINTQLKMKQTQIDQLHAAFDLLSREQLSGQEKFERIAQPSFMAVDQALADMGYTKLTYYKFAIKNETEISRWLSENTAQAERLDAMESEKNTLLAEYDLVIKQTAVKD